MTLTLGCFHGPGVVFGADLDQLDRVKEVVEGIGAVPELVLPPEAEGDREEEKRIQVRGLRRQEAGLPGGEAGPLSAKKPSRLQTISRTARVKAETVSYSSSDQLHSPICMTG